METCPKCGYVRSAADTAPDWQCPACGIVYAKYGSVPHVHAHNLNPQVPDDQIVTGGPAFIHDEPPPHAHAGNTPTAADEKTIAEFQAARQEMQPRWNRNWLFFAAPGFILIAVGGNYNSLAMQIPGMVLFLIAMIRGARLILRYMRCPACGAIQTLRVYFPYRRCRSCDARLSLGVKDSM